jgi:undecaprenyl-diphosphatase
MQMWHALILGVIQGLTEFFPISSTGHLIIAEKLLGISGTPLFFNVIIQLGSILALLVVYYDVLLKNTRDLLKNTSWRSGTQTPAFVFWLRLAIATIPALILGVLLHDDVALMQQSPLIVAITALGVAGVMWWFQKTMKHRFSTDKPESQQTVLDYFMIGMFQAVSLIPGVSRSGSAVLGGLYQKFSFEQAVHFSFLLGLPTMIMAAGYEVLQMLSIANASQGIMIQTGIGFVTSFFVSLLTIKWTLPIFKKYGFMPFIVYRVVLGVGLLALFAYEFFV